MKAIAILVLCLAGCGADNFPNAKEPMEEVLPPIGLSGKTAHPYQHTFKFTDEQWAQCEAQGGCTVIGDAALDQMQKAAKACGDTKHNEAFISKGQV